MTPLCDAAACAAASARALISSWLTLFLTASRRSCAAFWISWSVVAFGFWLVLPDFVTGEVPWMVMMIVVMEYVTYLVRERHSI